MAYTNRSYHQAGYTCPPSGSLHPFLVESAEWNNQAWTEPCEGASSIEPVNYPTQRGVHTPAFPTMSIGDSLQEGFYMPKGVRAVQSTLLRGPENWAPQNTLHLDPMPFNLSSPFMPTISSSTAQFTIPNGPSMSTSPPEYTWVPQRQYALAAYQFTPAPPILFNADSAEPGIRLSAALNRRFTNLRDRDDLVFESSRSPTITMRLEWPGYMPWSRQVRILDSRSVRQSISREKLAYEVAKTLLAFAQPQNGKLSAKGATDRDRMWAIGDGNIGLDDLVLVRVENVSRGSWQPQFLMHRQRRN